MVSQAEFVARRRKNALKMPHLDKTTVMRVDKINDTAAASITVARTNYTPGDDQLSALIETAPVTTRKPALVFGGGATCDNAVGRQIVRTTKEVWAGEPLIAAPKQRGPKIICTVWHLQGGGFVAPASRQESPALLTYWPEDRRCSAFVIHVAPWAEYSLPWFVYVIFGLIVCGLMGFIYDFFFGDMKQYLYIQDVDLKATAEEAREQDRLEREVSAGVVHMRRLSFAEDPIRAFICVFLFLYALFGILLSPLLYLAFQNKELVFAPSAAAEAAAEAAAAELLANEPAPPRDGARAGVRRRAPRGQRRERTRGATPSAKEPAPAVAVPESKPDAPAAPESKSEAPPAAPEAKGEEEEALAAPAVPRGYENVARALAHLDEARLLPLFEAQQIDDAALPTLEPSTLVELGVPPMVCLALSGAAASGKAKKLEADDLLDGVAKHQSVLEEALREHRAELARLKISSASELPEDLCCPITTELMSEPVMCVGDGNTYERAAIEQWFATGARTSPTTNAQLDSITLVPNLTVKRLIAAELERRGRTV